MSDCENFESKYHDWQQGRLSLDDAAALARHAAHCRHCSVFNPETAKISQLLRNQPVYRPKNGFEMRLERSIKAVENHEAPVRLIRKASFTPKLTALGAGLATGLAVGIFALTIPVNDSGNPPASVANNVSNQLIAEATPSEKSKSSDSLLSKQDSILKSDSHYSVGDYGKMVSGR